MIETDNDLLVPIRMSQLSQMSQTNWQCLQIVAYCLSVWDMGFVPMSKGPSVAGYAKSGNLAHLGRHVGFDPDHMAAMSGAWLRRKVRHPWLGGPRRLTMYLATLDCATSNPSLSSSPWMRGAPQSGFSTLIRRINTRSSVSICGRPPCGDAGGQVVIRRQLKRRHVLAFFEKRPGCHQLRMSPEGQRSQRVQPTGD